MDNNRVSPAQMDLLREIGTIGMGRAATALSELLNCKVEITLPQTKIIPLESLGSILGEPEEIYFVLDIGLEGDIGGRLFFLVSPKEAKILGSALLGQKPEDMDSEDPLFQSALKEMVNIIAGAYMNVLSDMTTLTIMYTIPSLAMDMVSALLDFFFIHISQFTDDAVFIDANLKVEDIQFKGTFLYFLEPESMLRIFEMLGVDDS